MILIAFPKLVLDDVLDRDLGTVWILFIAATTAAAVVGPLQTDLVMEEVEGNVSEGDTTMDSGTEYAVFLI